MAGLNRFICKQGQLLLSNSRYAAIWTSLLAVLPYAAWLSLVAIALVTLRKGWREGLMVLLPALAAHCSLSLLSMPFEAALVNSLIMFVPCYLAACTLFSTTNWQAVAGLFFLEILLAVILIHVFVPGFVTAQSTYLIAVIKQAQPENALLDYLQNASAVKQAVIANYLLGTQLLIIAFSALVPLLLARSIQSNLFYPEGFKQEILAFRGNKTSLCLLVGLLIAAISNQMIAIDALPATLFYFVLAGLSVSANGLIKKKMRGVFILLMMPLVLLPFAAMPVYIVLGVLDSLFNLRMHFAENRMRG